jgi:hypothetical protein
VNTPISPSRLAFAALCLLGIVVIGYGAALEITRQRRGATLVSPRQFRIRMISASIWITILAANAYAVTALWPQANYLTSGKLTPESKAQARLFVQVIGGSFSLVFIGLFLFLLDVRQTTRERLSLQMQHQRDLVALARESAASLQAKRETQAANETPDTP